MAFSLSVSKSLPSRLLVSSLSCTKHCIAFSCGNAVTICIPRPLWGWDRPCLTQIFRLMPIPVPCAMIQLNLPPLKNKQYCSHSCSVPVPCIQSRTPLCCWGILAAEGGYSAAEFGQMCPGTCSVRAGVRSPLYLDHCTVTPCCFTDVSVSHSCRVTKIFLSKQMFKWLFNLHCSELSPCNCSWVE